MLRHRLRRRIEIGGRGGERPAELGMEGPWIVYNRNSTVCQLLLLGVKADCLSLREGQQETGSSNSRAAEEWLHDGPKGRPLTFLDD